MKKTAICLCAALASAGCTTTNENVLGDNKSQVELRNMQSRSFETGDKAAVMRGVISTMQDLGFIIDKADDKLGTVSGTSFSNRSKMTITVREQGKKTMVVRANATMGTSSINDPRAYQNFFNSLSQALFLQANGVE